MLNNNKCDQYFNTESRVCVASAILFNDTDIQQNIQVYVADNPWRFVGTIELKPSEDKDFVFQDLHPGTPINFRIRTYTSDCQFRVTLGTGRVYAVSRILERCVPRVYYPGESL